MVVVISEGRGGIGNSSVHCCDMKRCTASVCVVVKNRDAWMGDGTGDGDCEWDV